MDFIIYPRTFLSFPLAFFIAVCQYIDMVCIYCGYKTRVTNSRSSRRSSNVWRRRRCLHCKALFTSRERADLGGTHVVKHSDGSLEAFSRDNLFISIYESCGHRKSALTDAEALTDTIISMLLSSHELNRPSLTTKTITTLCKTTLEHFDAVAATYYAAYYGLGDRE